MGGAALPGGLQVQAAPVVEHTAGTGTLTIHKTTADADTSLAGAEFGIYRVVRLTPGTEEGAYASWEAEPAFAELLGDVKQDAFSRYSAAELMRLVTRLAGLVRQREIQPSGKTVTNQAGDAVFENLPLGYYLVVEQAAPAGYLAGNPFLIAVPSTNEAGTDWKYEVTASPKNRQTVKELAPGENGTYGLGDVVNYVVSAQIPNYPDDYFTEEGHSIVFQIQDELSKGLTILNDAEHPVKVKVGAVENVAAAGAYTLAAVADEEEGKADLTVSFLEDYIRSHRGEAVELSYSAKINENAVTGAGGNPNRAELVYNTSPTVTAKAEPPAVKVYSFRIKVEKFAEENGAKKALDGAVFELYQGGEAATAEKIGTEYATDEAGELLSPQLSEGTYWLRETKAPAGYTLLANPIQIVIAAERTGGSASGGFALSVDGETVSDTVTEAYSTRLQKAEGVAVVAIENQEGFQLPAAGGAGAAGFLLAGLAGMTLLLGWKNRAKKRA